MVFESVSVITPDFSHVFFVYPSPCPCKSNGNSLLTTTRRKRSLRKLGSDLDLNSNWRWGYRARAKWVTRACVNGGDHHNFDIQIMNNARGGARNIIIKRFADELDAYGRVSDELEASSRSTNNFASFQEDPFVDKLRTQLGVMHPLPSPPINRSIFGLFALFFFVGVVFDKVWTSRKGNPKPDNGGNPGIWPQVPTNLSSLLEKDLQRKESVEWVNMVLGKLWKVYRPGIENWIIGLLQPVIDNLKKPDYVQRVEIKQFSLGDEPLSVRSVERRTSRRVNDLQYQIGLRYTGGARMLLMLSLKFGVIPIVVPVGVRNFDIDGELWVKLRLIQTEPWIGAVSWAFVSLPKIKLDLSPFRLFNLMAIPVLSMFLKKLLTEDLPRLFVRPKKIVLDFQNGKAVGPVPNDLKSGQNEPKAGEMQEGNKDFAGELSATLVDARKLSYIIYGKTDPYVILRLGDQVIRSKRNSQTTVIGPPGEPIWNQDFHMFVTNPRGQKLYIEAKDSLGFTDLTIGAGEVDLVSLKDTVPTDIIVVLKGWGLLGPRPVGEILLRLTYKAYVEDEEDERIEARSRDLDASDDELSDLDERDTAAVYEQRGKRLSSGTDKESFMDLLAALIVSEEFQGIVASETSNIKSVDEFKTRVSTSRQRIPARSVQQNSDTLPETVGESALFWLAIITSISVLIALNVSGSSIFNP